MHKCLQSNGIMMHIKQATITRNMIRLVKIVLYLWCSISIAYEGSIHFFKTLHYHIVVLIILLYLHKLLNEFKKWETINKFPMKQWFHGNIKYRLLIVDIHRGSEQIIDIDHVHVFKFRHGINMPEFYGEMVCSYRLNFPPSIHFNI